MVLLAYPTVDGHRSRRAMEKLHTIQLDVLVKEPAAVCSSRVRRRGAAPASNLAQGTCHGRHIRCLNEKPGTQVVKSSVLLAVPAVPDARAGPYARPPHPAPKEHPELREAHAGDTRCQLG